MGLRNALPVQRHLSDRRFACIAEFEQGTVRSRAGDRTGRIDGGLRRQAHHVGPALPLHGEVPVHAETGRVPPDRSDDPGSTASGGAQPMYRRRQQVTRRADDRIGVRRRGLPSLLAAAPGGCHHRPRRAPAPYRRCVNRRPA